MWCEPKTQIKRKRGLNTKGAIWSQKPRTLIRLDIRRCSECGKLLTIEGLMKCPRNGQNRKKEGRPPKCLPPKNA